jgi:CubicO group peptidase (beta-lactamase class C family)
MSTSQPKVSFPRSRPEELGISSSGITNFLAAIRSSGLELHSFMLLRHGQVAAEGWWAPYRADLPHSLFSVSKSFTSTAIGFAVTEELLTVNDHVITYFPEELPETVSDFLAQMTIRDLLIMGTGHTQETMDAMHAQPDGNWVKAFLHVPVEKEPGTHFFYNTGATYMLSAILQKVSGQTLLEYLESRLFSPLGILNPTWETCPRGINTGGFGLSVTTEDIAKLGQLYLQKGIWNGQRLLDEKWIQAATSKQISNGDDLNSDWNQGYGYQFWQSRHGAYRGDGAFGQYCLVMPEQDAVIAITSAIDDMQIVLNAIWDHLLTAMGPAPLPPCEAEADRVATELSELAIHPSKGQDHSSMEALMEGKLYKLEDKQNGWQSFTVSFAKADATITLVHEENTYVIKAGRNNWLSGTSQIMDEIDRNVVCSFTWQTTDILEFIIRFIETPVYITVEVKVDGDTIALKEKLNVSFGPKEREEIIGRA